MTYFFAWCWAGIIIGVSFIATPAKFLATSPSRSQLLEVGKVTFNTFQYVEFILFLVLSVCIIRERLVLVTYKVLLASIFIILVTQYGILLAILDERITSIMQGDVLKPTSLHQIYVFAELSKIALLLVLGNIAHKQYLKSNSNRNTSHAINYE